MEEFLSGNELFADRAVLEGEIRRLGVAIRLEPEIRDLLRPAPVAGRRVGNRFVIQPMEGCDGTLEGRPDELTYHRWGRFARGGAKMLWGEAVAVVPEGRANPRQLLFSRENVPALAGLLAFAREEHQKACGNTGDFLVGLQLTHSGRWARPRAATLSDSELDRLQDAYVQAAAWCREIGADFVDVKQCHGYLLSELLGAKSRPGKYGGPLENRTRFACEIFRRIRGIGLILASRMNVFDSIPFVKDPKTGVGHPAPAETPGFGTNPDHPTEPDLREPLEAIRLFRDAGLQLLNVSMGCPYVNPHIGRPADREPPDGYGQPESGLVGVARHFDLAAQVQAAFPDLLVVGTGYSYLRHFAAEAGEANVRDGRITFVGLGRGAIAYPDFVRDLQESGSMKKLKSCITVSYCTTLMRSKDNALGQYAAGCVPRDPVYAKLLQEIQKKGRAT